MNHTAAKLTVAAITNAILAAIVCSYIFLDWRAAVMTTFFLGAILVLHAYRRIQNDPPHAGQWVLWGENVVGDVRDPGYYLTFLRPLWRDIIPINISPEPGTVTLPIKKVRVHDFGEADIEVAYIIVPGYLKRGANGETTKTPQHIATFVNVGKHAGAIKILNKGIEERIRQWAGSPIEGPVSTREIQGANREATAILVKRIAGRTDPNAEGGIPPIEDTEIPTLVLMRFFSQGLTGLRQEEINRWGPIWESYPDDRKTRIRLRVDERSRYIDQLVQGSASILLEHLGCYLIQLNVTKIVPTGEVAEAIEEERKERAQTVSQGIERDNLSDLMISFQKPRTEGGPGLPAEQSYVAALLLTGKMEKVKMFGLDPLTTQMLGSLVSGLMARNESRGRAPSVIDPAIIQEIGRAVAEAFRTTTSPRGRRHR